MSCTGAFGYGYFVHDGRSAIVSVLTDWQQWLLDPSAPHGAPALKHWICSSLLRPCGARRPLFVFVAPPLARQMAQDREIAAREALVRHAACQANRAVLHLASEAAPCAASLSP